MPQVFFGKCCRLLKDQEKRVNQEFNRIYGSQRVALDTQDESESLFSHPQSIPARNPCQDSDEYSYMDQNSTSSSNVIVSQKLMKIESNFRIVTSLYDDMQEYQGRQSDAIDSVSKRFDTIDKNINACSEAVADVNRYEQGNDMSYTRVAVYCLIAMITLLMLRIYRI